MNNTANQRSNNGYTLIELLIAITLLGIILGSSTVLFKTVVHNNLKSRTLNNLKNQEQRIAETLNRMVIGSKDLAGPDGVSFSAQDGCISGTSTINITQLDNSTQQVVCDYRPYSNGIFVTKDAYTVNLIESTSGTQVIECSFACVNKSTLSYLFTLEAVNTSERVAFSLQVVARNVPKF